MKKTVYCSDVDGTLARQGYFLTEDTLALVHEMVDADINFTIVTGRFLSRSLPVMQQPEQELGRLAAEYLLQRMDGSAEPARVTRLNCQMLP